MNLNELICYYTAKLAYPDLTQHSRNIATATLIELPDYLDRAITIGEWYVGD